MSHEIETHGTQAAAVFARKDAWHRLGTTVRDRAFTAEEAMRLGHLGGWNVRKLPLTTAEVSEGGVTAIEVPGFATVRTNPFTGEPEALGVVGGGQVGRGAHQVSHCAGTPARGRPRGGWPGRSTGW